MRNVDDEHHEALVKDLVDDPVWPPACAPESFEVALQGFADLTRVAGEVAVDELDDRRHDARGNAAEVALGGPANST